jgi:hypothetical protein
MRRCVPGARPSAMQPSRREHRPPPARKEVHPVLDLPPSTPPPHPTPPHPAGNPMVPVSWQEMLDPETQRRERRKVAKVAAPPS